MSDTQRTQLEEELAKMTTYTGEETALWRSALERSKTKPARAGILYSFNWRSPWLAAAVIAILGSVATFALMLPQGRARDRPAAVMAPTVSEPRVLFRVGSDEAEARPARPPLMQNGYGTEGSPAFDPSSPRLDGEVGDSASASRMVIRRATIELAAEDVRGTYLRIMQIPAAHRGEFIDDSSLTGNEPDRLHGSVTLRVAADRLPEILNELREFGRVVSEQSKADDVTAQHVDLEARLRNEMRIEEELLDLLSKREDAPLKDVLELQRHLQQVRGQIERLTAQRDGLSRLVSLATILVIIKPEVAQPEPDEPEEEETLGGYFLKNILDSGKAGLYLLADTLAVLVHLAIGGLIWWVIAFTLIMAARTMWRRNAMAA